MHTFGPRVPDSKSILALLQSGMAIARLKLVFGQQKNYTEIVKKLRRQAKILGKKIDILAELTGPRLRVAKIARVGLDLFKNQNIIIAATYDLQDINSQTLPSIVVPINYPFLAEHIKKGDQIGLGHETKLSVLRVEDNFIYARVARAGTILSGDELSIPYLKIKTDIITGQDIENLKWAVTQDIDFVVPHLARSARDIIFLKKIIQKIKPKTQTKILAKIDSIAAWANRHELESVANGLILDIHNLAQEIPKAKLALIEREFINKKHATEKIYLMVQ